MVVLYNNAYCGFCARTVPVDGVSVDDDKVVDSFQPTEARHSRDIGFVVAVVSLLPFGLVAVADLVTMSRKFVDVLRTVRCRFRQNRPNSSVVPLREFQR